MGLIEESKPYPQCSESSYHSLGATPQRPRGIQERLFSRNCQNGNQTNIEDLLMSPEWQNKILSFEDLKLLRESNRTKFQGLKSCLKIPTTYPRFQSRNANSFTYSGWKDGLGLSSAKHPSQRGKMKSKHVSFSVNVLVYAY